MEQFEGYHKFSPYGPASCASSSKSSTTYYVIKPHALGTHFSTFGSSPTASLSFPLTISCSPSLSPASSTILLINYVDGSILVGHLGPFIISFKTAFTNRFDIDNCGPLPSSSVVASPVTVHVASSSLDNPITSPTSSTTSTCPLATRSALPWPPNLHPKPPSLSHSTPKHFPSRRLSANSFIVQAAFAWTYPRTAVINHLSRHNSITINPNLSSATSPVPKTTFCLTSPARSLPICFSGRTHLAKVPTYVPALAALPLFIIAQSPGARNFALTSSPSLPWTKLSI